MPYKERLDELLNNAKQIVNSDPETSLKNVLELYSEMKESNDYESRGKLCKFIGTIYLKNGMPQLSVEYYEQAISNFILVNNLDEIGKIYNNLVIAAYYHKDYNKIEEYSKLALHYFEESGDTGGIISVTNNLAKYYRNIEAFDKAYSLLKMIISRYEKTIDDENRTIMLANYANVLINLGNTDEGLKILLKLSEEVDERKDNHCIAIVNLYLTEYYESIGDYKRALECHKKRYRSAIVGRQEDISSDLNRYLSTFNLDIDKLKFERLEKQNEELIEAHSEISKKNGLLETLINTIPLPLFYCDLDYNYLGCNDEFVKYFHKNKTEIIGKKVGFTLTNEEEINFLSQKINQARTSKTPIHFISKLTRAGNDTRTVEIFYSGFYNKAGALEGLLCMLKDITQDIEQQEVVKRLNAHLQSILESASQVYICSIDRDYKFRYFNTNYANAVKRHIGLEISKGFDYFKRYQSQEEIRDKKKLLDRVFSGETISGVREYSDRKKPEILQYFYSPIVEEGGQIIGATVFSYDITEGVLAQRELALSNKTKDKFFSIIAHDLRSPIGNIKSALEFLTTEEHLSTEEMMEMLDKLSASAINTYDLLENLLQWSLTQRGLIENNSFTYRLCDLITGAIKISRNIAHSKRIELEVRCNSEIEVFVDKNMFFTILRNLINNAIKYSFENSVIEIEVESDQKYAVVKVIDHGVGIKAEVIPYLNQLDKTVTTYGTAGEIGSGLGLVLCNELVNKLGGKLWVESKEGKVSAFSFTLPVNERY
ncbi:PAS domain-containing sensor histidine kinase [bacterium]|nr:PAS domain-containing sensor histidine kinase [bacterium]